MTQINYDPSDSRDENKQTKASFHEQETERQTIYMDTSGGRLYGTFRLTMEDEYGDRWTTIPIPTEIQLSIIPRDAPTYVVDVNTGEVGEYGVVVDFGYDTATSSGGSSSSDMSPGLRLDELGLGDVIRCGDEYRTVQRLRYMDATTKEGRSRWRWVHFSGTMRRTDAGRPWHRVTMSKEIRAALIGLPIERMRDVTVRGIADTGRRLSPDVNTYLNLNRAEFYSDVSNLESPEDTIVVGDYLRIGREWRQVLEMTTLNRKYTIQPFHYPTTLSGAFKHTGMDYEVTFHSGCRDDSDCRYNGIDEMDSDGGECFLCFFLPCCLLFVVCCLLKETTTKKEKKTEKLTPLFQKKKFLIFSSFLFLFFPFCFFLFSFFLILYPPRNQPSSNLRIRGRSVLPPRWPLRVLRSTTISWRWMYSRGESKACWCRSWSTTTSW